MNDDVVSRLAALEERVSAFLPEPLSRRPNVHEPAAWLRAQMHASVERRRAETDTHMMSTPDAAIILIEGQINEATEMAVSDTLEAAHSARVLHLRIDSDGGDYGVSLRIYRAIRWHGADEKIAFMGKHCDSGALLLALAADRRVMGCDSHVLLHLVGGLPDASERWTASEHLAAARRLSEMDAEMLNVIADRTGASLDVIVAEARSEYPAETAWLLKHGFVHEIAEDSR